MYWELWDVASGALIASFDTRDEAIASVRALVNSDSELVADLAIGAIYELDEPQDQPLPPALEGRDLAAAISVAPVSRPTMTSSHAIEDRVRKWLTSNFNMEVESEPLASFKFRVKPNARDSVYAVGELDRQDRVCILGALEFGEEERTLLARLSTARQRELESETWRELVRLDVQFDGLPQDGRMRFLTWLFEDALTQDELYRRIVLIYRAISIPRRIYSREFNRITRQSKGNRRSQRAPNFTWTEEQRRTSQGYLLPFPDIRVAM